MEQRLESGRSVVERRKAEAESLTLCEKAEYFEQRLLDQFLLKPHHLVSKYLGPDRNIGHLGHTSLLLATLAFKYGTLRSDTDEALAQRIVNSFAALDAANGFDGYIPERARLGDHGLVVTDNETHSNAYTLLLFAYQLAYQHFEAPELKAAIRDHVKAIAHHFLKHNLVLRDETGTRVPVSNVSPTPLQFSTSRCLDGLVLVETTMALLAPAGDLGARMMEYRKKMLRAGYLEKIQHLHLAFCNFVIPTHSSQWLNFVRLYTLTQVSDELAYRTALENLYRSQRKGKSPLSTMIYLSVVEDPSSGHEMLKHDMNAYLNSFPLSLDDSEVINSRDRDIRQKLFPPIRKNAWRPEAEIPLPIYRRPLSHNEWVRNPFRIDGNFNHTGKMLFPGTDFLWAYWMGRYYKFIQEAD